MQFASPHPESRRRTRVVVAVAAVLALGAAGCGSDEESTDGTDAPATASPAATEAPAATGAPAATDAPAATGAPAAGAATVAVADTDLGTILVDGEGRTLYLFMPDAQGPSTCTGDCLGAWPALLGPAEAGDGVDASLLGTAARPDDGTAQVTFDGWPLYYFAQDAAPGDTHGQGVGDVWYVVDPTGAAIGAPSAPATTTDRGY